MGFLDADPVHEQNVLNDARLTGMQFHADMSPAWYTMEPTAPLKGLASGVNAMAMLASDASIPVVSPILKPIDNLTGWKLEDWYLADNKKLHDAADYLKLDPKANGVLGDVVHGLFKLAPVAVVAAGTGGAAAIPVGAGGTFGYEGYQDALHQKMDTGTALGMGAITALSTWAGLKIPMHASAYLPTLKYATGLTVKEGLAANVAAGAIANVPLGMTTRGVTAEWLRANGYPDQAKNYEIFDQQALAVDLIMGGGFGAIGHYAPALLAKYKEWRDANKDAFNPSDKDAALALNEALHRQNDTAPGIAADLQTLDAHAREIDRAIRALVTGEPFTVGDGVTNGTWVENPSAEISRLSVAQAVAQHMGQDWVDLQHDTHQSDIAVLKAELEARGMDTSMLDLSGPALERQAAKANVELISEVPDSAFNGDLRHSLENSFYEPETESVQLANRGFRPDEIASLERAGLAADGVMSREQFASYDREVSHRLSGRSRPKVVAPSLNIPGAITGKMSQVKVGDIYRPTQWILVDVAQHQATLTKGENQFRDRANRVGSEAQIEKIANAPDVLQLLDSPLMDYGAPTMDRNGNIIGGNGRVEGLSRAYDRGTGNDYLGPLKDRLAQYGIDPAAADNMKKPVLMRAFVEDVNVKDTAIASNEGGGQRMSEPEQAKVDAHRLPDIRGLVLNDNGSISSVANKQQIMNWASKFPVIEQNTLIDSNGILSVQGERRFQNAILFQAFGDGGILNRLIESRDPEVRNVALALTRSGPKIAEAKASMVAGDMNPIDITPELTAAVEKLADLRRNGVKLAEYLLQNEMFGADQLSPEARKILVFLAENTRSVKAMSEMINSFFDQVKAAGNPNARNVFDLPPPTKPEILDAAIAATGKRVKNGELIETAPAADQQAAAELAQPAPQTLPREDTPDAPVNPGEEFLVVRAGSEEGLQSRNGASTQGLAAFLADADDPFSSVVAAKGQKLFVYAAKVDQPFGQYSTFNNKNGGRPGDAVGRREKHGGVWYSFPENGYESRLLYEIPMTEVRARLKELGFQDFDETGSIKGGEIIREMIAEKQKASETAQQPAPDLSNLSPGEHLQYRVDNDFEGLLKEYAQLPEAMGGKMVSGDIAKELSPDYMNDRTLAAEVHEAASSFAKKLYQHILDQPVPAGQDPVVLITGGGTGAGKSSGLDLQKDFLSTYNAIYDTTMGDLRSSEKKIQQALDAGREVVLQYVYREPVEAFVNGNLTRAMTQGRTVPISAHAESHIGSRDTIERLAEKYAGDDRVVIQAIDNSRGKGNQAFAPLDSLPKTDSKNLGADLYAALEKEYRNANISRAVYEATAARPREAQGVSGENGSGVLAEPAGGVADVPGTALQSQELKYLQDPEVGAALADHPEMLIPTETGQAMPASGALDIADANVLKAEADAPAFDAAITCMLRG